MTFTQLYVYVAAMLPGEVFMLTVDRWHVPHKGGVDAPLEVEWRLWRESARSYLTSQTPGALLDALGAVLGHQNPQADEADQLTGAAS